MLPQYIQKINTAKSKKGDIKKLLAFLQSKRPGDLDTVTNRLHDEAFDNIDCLQCANCCKTTGPLLISKDVSRLAQAVKLAPGNFMNTYLKTDEDGDVVFKQMPCMFLNNNNYCKVYHARPNACRDYPHTQQNKIIQKLEITLHNSMICPAVADVVAGLKKYYMNK
ncbi:MAG: YkgJ family cysteine cluster protein [Bacteroidia bacterium]|nr:YkgJ family cysteine cluster protein [Bacteroidia bacterium]HQU99681.1 YkgJ family cysteine cluster protein [Bacteroidia bacterium]